MPDGNMNGNMNGAANDWQIAVNSNPVREDPSHIPVTAPVRRRPHTFVLAIIAFFVLSVVVLIVAGYLIYVLGPGALILSIVLAIIPLGIVLVFIRWIDRWEPEPRGTLLFALLWGAGASVLIALIFSGITQRFEAGAGLTGSGVAQFFSAVVQAPVIEESAKGLGILIVFLAVRRHFDGPVDGIVYAATVAIGFAFTENIQYFGLAIQKDGGLGAGVAGVFLLRAVLSPFAHVMFTSCTGLALGLAARRSTPIVGVGYFVLGLIPAILLHGLWNSASYWAANWFDYYFAVQVPLFIIAVVGIVILRRFERQLTHRRLSEYANVGWFTPSEVNVLSTGAGRRSGIRYARHLGLGRPYRQFVRDATRLAFVREQLVNGRDRQRSTLDEAALLAAIIEDRRALAVLPSLTARPPQPPQQ